MGIGEFNMNGYDKVAKISLPTTINTDGVNVFLIKGDTITLVDAGHNIEGSWEVFNDQLKSYGYTVKDIKQIIITHHHVDHIGFIKYFDHDITLIGHSDCERWLNPTTPFLEQHDVFFNELFNQLSVPDDLAKQYLIHKNDHVIENAHRGIDLKVKEGSEIPDLSEWRIVHTFGHCQGHISLFHPEDKILIGGDILMPHISPNPILEPPLHIGGERLRPQIQLNETLRKLFDLQIERVLPGHGEDITNARELINIRLKRQHERAIRIRDWLVEEPMTAFEVCSRLFPKSYKSRLGLTLFETVGHLDYLIAQNLIIEARRKDGFNYSVSIKSKQY